MKFLQLLFPFKSRFALMAGILAGFTVLSLTIVFLLNDSSAAVIIWIGIGMSMIPLFITGKGNNAKNCNTNQIDIK